MYNTIYGAWNRPVQPDAFKPDKKQFFTRIIALLSGAILIKSEGLLESQSSQKRIEHHFITADSISMVFIEVKKILTIGKSGLNIKR